MKKTILFFICMLTIQWVSSQNFKVSGTITGAEDGEPLIGVNVIVQGETGMGTVTDFDGKYAIDVPKGKSLYFSYIGYLEQTKTIKENTTLNIILQSDAKMLDEVVAVGYGTMKKSDLTGSVTSISADKLKETPASGIDKALQGRAAGVTVNANSGQPGAAAQVRIRGIGSVTSDSSPIYVVDGVILSDISFLSPSDITATEVLKDASATAIFGSRGANGVILVTTKRGSDSPEGNITVDTYFGVQNAWKKLDLMKRDEFAQTLSKYEINNAWLNANGLNSWIETWKTGADSPYFPDGFDYTTVDTDWQDEVFVKNAPIQNHYISFDGGSKTSQYALSVSWFDQQGIVIGSDFNRLTVRANTSHNVKKWLKIGENLTFMNSGGRTAMNNNASPSASVLSAAIAMAPWDPAYYPEGSWSYKTTAAGGYPDGRDLGGQISASSNKKEVTNPLSMVKYAHPMADNNRWVGDVYVEIQPIKKLTLRSDISMDLANNTDGLFKDAYLISGTDKLDTNFYYVNMHKYSTIINENILTYADKIGIHDFSIMVGETTQEYNHYRLGASGKNIANPIERNWLMSQTQLDGRTMGDEIQRTRMMSYLSRVNYQLLNKYMITANFRVDGSNKFEENPWGYFPSTSAGWKISEEPFMKGIAILDFMKVRLGWGQIGNEKINASQFTTNMTTVEPWLIDYVLGSTQTLASGATVLSFANVGGKWETTEQWNAGIDFGLFKGLISGNVDLYLKDTKDLLLVVKAPAYVGNRFDAIANAGTLRNQGIEIALDHRNKIGAFNYSVGGNISFVKNEILEMNGGQRVFSEGNILLSDEGLAVNTFWGYVYEGVYQTDQEAADHFYGSTSYGFHAGDAKFKDLNNDGLLNENDKTDLGNPFPWLTYGINGSFDWKGFDCQVFLQGVYGNKIYNAVRLRTEGTGETNLSTTMRDAWSLDNLDGTIPNPLGSPYNFYTSSRYIESGAYLRLKNLQLGYTIPKQITNQIGIDRCRFYVSASNLLTFTKYTGYDPEISTGVDYGNYPQSRTVLFGANLNF